MICITNDLYITSFFHTGHRLFIEDLLQLQDDGSRIPSAGLFFYTPNMPAMMLTNACTLLGQVNGATGSAVGITVDPTADFFEVDSLYIMCTKPPLCVLFKPDSCRISDVFDGLDPSITPIFPFEKSISWQGYSIRRRQVPMCPGFCFTQYKVQGLSLKNAVLDMKAEPRRTVHEKYTSNYVLLGRLEASDGVNLLQKIDMADLLFKPDPRLLNEMDRLRTLEKEIMTRWAEYSED